MHKISMIIRLLEKILDFFFNKANSNSLKKLIKVKAEQKQSFSAWQLFKQNPVNLMWKKNKTHLP